MNQTRNLVYTSLLTALIIAGTYIRIPVGPVPIVLATIFVILAGLLLRFWWALASVILYLGMGAIGLPVFSAGGGIALLVGPTGGYLAGYLLAAIVANIVSTADPDRRWLDIIAVIAATIAIYLPGVPWLKISLDMSWQQAISAGLLPFLIGDAVKAAVAIAVFTTLKRRYPELVPRITHKR